MSTSIGTGRLEAFSDGVIAIIITIMVLELKVPHGTDISVLKPLIPVFLSYVLSFIYVGIYWNNHHHLLRATDSVSGGILWANLHLLFWLSLFPFVTGWMGENFFGALPTALYGAVCFMAAFAYGILQMMLLKEQGENSVLVKALSKDFKIKISPVIYAIAIIMSFYCQWIAGLLYLFVALMWLAPVRRIEKELANGKM